MDYLPYPEPDAKQGGCRISSYYYKDHAKALEASKAAQHNGDIMRANGHEDGFVHPGSLSFSKYRNMWEVATV